MIEGFALPAALALAAAEADRRAETELARHLGQRGLGDQRRAELRQVALEVIGEPRVEQVGHAQVEDRVSQELQPFVRLDDVLLVGVRAMGQSNVEQARVLKDTPSFDSKIARAPSSDGEPAGSVTAF